MKNSDRISCLAGLVLAAMLSACGGGGGASGPQPRNLAEQPQRATPASCSYARLYVTVEAVRVLQHTAGGAQWVDIALPAPQAVDLLDTSGGILQALGAAPLAPGQYTQVQLVLSSGAWAHAVQPAGGALRELTVPSGAQSGLKLHGEFTVAAGSSGDLVLRGFDPCQAVVQAGSPGAPTYLLKPEARAGVVPVTAPPETAIGSGEVMPLLGGGYVLWRQEPFGIVVQRYGADRQPVGAPATIPASAAQITFSIAPLVGGGYAAVWLTQLASPVYQAYTQSYTAAGVPIGSPLALAQTNPGALSRPAAVPQIAALADGSYVVVWGLQQSAGGGVLDTGVYSQRINADGTPAGAVQQAVAEGSGFLDVSGLAHGGYVVSWGDLSGTEGGARVYSAAGEPLAAAQTAGSSWGQGAGPRGDVVSLAGGGAVMVWQERNGPLMVQQLAPGGAALPASVVNVGTTTFFVYPAVGSLSDGGYVVAWAEIGGELYARRYAANGTPLGAPTRINLVTTQPYAVAVIGMAGGGFMIAWTGLGPDGVRRTYSRVFPAGGLLATP